MTPLLHVMHTASRVSATLGSSELCDTLGALEGGGGVGSGDEVAVCIRRE